MAGTDANVFVKIFGSKGDTGNMQLKSADNTKNKFERGRTDLFKLEATDIGKVCTWSNNTKFSVSQTPCKSCTEPCVCK